MGCKFCFSDENHDSYKLVAITLQIWPTQEIVAKMFKGNHKWIIVICSHKYSG